MTNVTVTKSINVPANAAWNKLAAFSGIEEFSPIARSVVEGEGVGAKRTCYMPDNAEINEKLNKLDDDKMELEYEIITGPFPITGYVSNVSVKSLTESSCEITWSASFEASEDVEEEMKNLFGGFYNVIIESLESLINNQN